MARFLPLCAVRVMHEGNVALQYFGAHDPVMTKTGPLQLLLKTVTGEEGERMQNDVVVHLCRRCGVLYIHNHSVSYETGQTAPIVMGPKGEA
jgi:hypothetical protein